MAKFQGGLKEAAKMLAGLSREARDRILTVIAKKDPAMAINLEKNLFSFEDIKFLTPVMYIEFLREIKIQDFALALRMASPELKDFVFKNSPRAIRQEIEDVLLGPLQLASHVTQAEERVMAVFLRKIEKGEIIIRKDDVSV
ncbi:MAG: hypothetical protein L6Q33_14135 [Bacteriovoracaceae bacterium]|jgi:flagellar motor switch protein FliG|nr:hypothetical protein [Bacteriovoracaceae bacterium]